MVRKLKEYALYKGEEILCIGTVKEIAEKMNIASKTVRFYGTKVYENRLKQRKNSRAAMVLVDLD